VAKDSIRDYSATSSDNSDIQSVDIAEGCAPSGLNNAIREVMTDLKNVSTGTVALETPVADSFSTDTISEKTSATGVTIDGVLLKDGAIGSIASAVAAHLTSINGGQIGGSRNLIINGNFDVWQRGTSFSNANNVYTADRFKVVAGGGTTGDTVSQQSFTAGQTDVPNEPTYFLRYAMGGTSSNKVMHHRIEDVRTGAGKTCTLTFYAKASTGHTSTVEVAQVFGSGGSSQVTQSAQNYTMTTSWQKFTFTIALPSISGKTIGTSSYVYIAFIRSLSSSNVSIDIAQMQFEVGEVATPFEHESYAETLQKCERYFQRFVAGANYTGFSVAFSTGATSAKATLKFNGKMRAAPTITQSNTGFNYGPQVAFSSFNTLYTGLDTSWIDMNIASVGSAGQLGIWNGNNNGAAYVQMSAEL